MSFNSFLSIILAGCILAIYTFSKIYRIRHYRILTGRQMSRLLELAKLSLESLDVPVGALLIYNGEIIGEGYNTVLRVSEAGGHAEINALTDAMKRLGIDRFSSLRRESLFLVTTFEPCLMCAGAFLNYNIRNVYFIKEKDSLYQAKEVARFIRYYFTRVKIKNDGEQDALFRQHPHYPKNRTGTGDAG